MDWLEESGKFSVEGLGLSPGVLEALTAQGPVCFRGGKERCIQREGERIRTGYFTGIAWLAPDIPIGIRPKFPDMDTAAMLDAAFQEPGFLRNAGDVDKLLFIDTEARRIPVDVQDDSLTPFLIASFLGSIRRLLHRGLLRRYQDRTANLRERVRGRVQVHRNMGRNTLRGDLLHVLCRFQEFTPDIPENRILKAALRFSLRYLRSRCAGLPGSMELAAARYLRAFTEVADVDALALPKGKHASLFAEYDVALRLADLLLQRFGFEYSSADSADSAELPPFWLNMPMLFEYYVLHRLHSIGVSASEIHFQTTVSKRKQRPDYLYTPAGEEGWIIDAKYKYLDGELLEIEDIRQVCGYARMRGVIEILGASMDAPVPALIIYPSLETTPEDFRNAFLTRSFDEEDYFFRVYRLRIDLPRRKNAV